MSSLHALRICNELALCLVIVYSFGMKHMEVTLVAFIDNQNRLLLNCRRNNESKILWELVGGGIEEGETPKAAIIREMKEELNYDLTKSNLEFIRQFSIQQQTYTANVNYFEATAPSLSAFESSDEVYVEDLQFFAIEDALQLTLLPMTKLVLEDKLSRQDI